MALYWFYFAHKMRFMRVGPIDVSLKKNRIYSCMFLKDHINLCNLCAQPLTVYHHSYLFTNLFWFSVHVF